MLTCLVAYLPIAAAPVHAPPQKPVHLLIDADSRTLSVYAGSALLRTFPVAVGKASTPTPLGSWRISEKAAWGGAFGTRWLRLSVPYGIYGVHGTNNPGSIGHFASHGCVRMLNRDVEQVYALVQEGTPVDVVGTPPRRTVVEGDRGSEISDVQQALSTLGDYEGPVSGVFTTELTSAVVGFQQRHGLRADGVVRRATYEALGLYPPRRVDPAWLRAPAGAAHQAPAHGPPAGVPPRLLAPSGRQDPAPQALGDLRRPGCRQISCSSSRSRAAI